MFTAGVAAHAVCDWLGVGAIRSFGVRFRSRVWPGDTLTTTVESADVERTGAGERVAVELRVDRDDEEAVITGSAEAVL
jgi:acyl dehydratase